jgi:proteasome accessory factor B
MDRRERLLNLLALLLHTRRPLTIDEIRERIAGYPERDDSFRRSFERDKDALRELGIEISVETVAFADPAAQGYLIRPDDYYLTDPGLDPDELAALNMAASMIDLDGISGARAGLDKLGGVDSSAADATTGLATLPTSPLLEPLFAAVTERRLADFVYGGVARTVHPYRLACRRGRWYLAAFDEQRDANRVFRVDRIEGDVELGPDPAAFELPDQLPDVTLDPMQLGEGELTRAQVLIDASHVPLAKRELDYDVEWVDRPDGSSVVTVQILNGEALVSWVLGHLGHAELLEPAELRRALVERLERFVS